jgi:enterochelin esterase family protein
VKTFELLVLLAVGVFSTTASAQTLESPRLQALKTAVEGGSPTAIEAFWDEVRVKGAPLIEQHHERAPYVLVTFLWRDDNTKQVFVSGQLGQLTGMRPADNLMSRLGDTSVWFRSYWLRSDARALYQLGVDIPATESGAATTPPALHPDPLNPRRWEPPPIPGGPPTQRQSILELPTAPPQRWLVRDPRVPQGSMEQRTWKSTALGNERSIWIYRPAGYNSAARPYPLVVATDGFGYAFTQQVPLTLDNLIATKQIPPVIMVFVANAPTVPGKRPTRSVELTCNPSFAEFLATEIVPFARATYHATSDPLQTIIAGSSYGGLNAACTALHRPDVFGNVLSQSGSFWWRPAGDFEGEWATKQYAERPKANLRFYMNVGLLEIANPASKSPDWQNEEDLNILDGPSMVVVNRHMRDVLKLKGYSVTYAEVAGGHNALNWQGTFGDGLIALLGPTVQSAR